MATFAIKGHGVAASRERSEVASHERPMPLVRAWYLLTRIGVEGRKVDGNTGSSTAIIAVCVNEELPISEHGRLGLMRDMAALRRELLAESEPSMWLYPAGYFGFDALRFAQLRKRKAKSLASAWPLLPVGTTDRLQRVLAEEILPLHGACATVVVGMDDGETQLSWVGQTDERGHVKSTAVIVRGATTIAGRSFEAGKLKAVAFVCGEFTGSATPSNGPFHRADDEWHYLDPVGQDLAGTNLVVDVAHSRVPGTVVSLHAPVRFPHQGQMENLARRGIASVLTHHHADEQIRGRAKNRHQSNWLCFADGMWADEADVRVLK